MSYYDQFDDPPGEERRILPFPRPRRLELVREEQLCHPLQEAIELLNEEEAQAEARQNELDAALKYLKWLISEGEQGFFPGKVLAAAKAGKIT